MAPRSIYIACAAGLVLALIVSAVTTAMAPPYSPGARQLALLAAAKEYGYDGVRFTGPASLIIFARPGAHRFQVRHACYLGQRAGLRDLTVHAVAEGDRTTLLETFRCDMERRVD